MILVDTDVLSAFAKIGRLPLLVSLFAPQKLYVTHGVLAELQHSLLAGRGYAADVFSLLTTGELHITELAQDETVACEALPDTLGRGEREGVAVAEARGVVLLSNESRVAHTCRERGVPCLRIPDILRALWTQGFATKTEVRTALGDLQEKDRMRFRERTVDAIFTDTPEA